MNSLKDNEYEIFNILQKTSLVNIKFSDINNYIAVAVLYSSDNMLDVLIDVKKSRYIVEYGEEVIIKFQRDGYEFILEGKITEVTVKEPATVTIKITNWNKHLNKRRFIRYDIQDFGELFYNIDDKTKCKILNLSLGGAMISCNTSFNKNKKVILKTHFFDDEIIFPAKIVRSIMIKSGEYTYGLEFENIDSNTEMLLRKTLLILEKSYLHNLGNLRQIKGNNLNIGKSIVVFNLCSQEDLEIKEALGNMGILDYSVFHDFKVYSDYFVEESPKLLIIDTEEITYELLGEINTIITSFNNLSIILVLPMQNVDIKYLSVLSKNTIDIVFKPFIYNELENVIVKHL